MRYLTLILALIVFSCYTGVCYAFNFKPTPDTTKTSCHTSHQSKIPDKSSTANSYSNPYSAKNQEGMCQDALTSAPKSNYFDLLNALYSITFIIPSVEITDSSNSRFNSAGRREYRPPDLFLLNSSFLI